MVDRTIALTLPPNLRRALRAEARRLDVSAQALVLNHVMSWLQTLPDPDDEAQRGTERGGSQPSGACSVR